VATQRLCSIPNCGKRVVAFGVCSAHYARLRKHGDPLGGRTPNGAALQWIRDHIHHTGGDCLIWPFNRDRAGYGLLDLPHAKQGAARYMCIVAHGEPPSTSHHAAHSCGKGHEGCLNPRHLSWKTPGENQDDRVAHGTSNRGRRNGSCKLTEEQVRQIRSLKGSLSQSKIAERFSVQRHAIHDIHTGKKWGWLP
jgi:hypothetical protein